MIQLTRFTLRPGVDEATWRSVDRAAQAVAHVQPGLLRRTTARSSTSATWLVVELWASAADADARAPDPALDCIDRASCTVERYDELPG